MNRKLLALNIALALVAIYAGYTLQQEWVAKRAREQAAIRARIKPAPLVPWKAEPAPPPVLPATYLPVARNLLLDRSRNPDLPPPPPPPAPPPPPVKKVPPLPGFHGEMNLDGPAAILSMGGAHPQAIRPGEMIGPFKLIDINKTTIVFEWDGNLISKPVDELIVRAAPPEVAANNGNPAAPPVAAPAPPQEKKALGPGESTQFGFKICQPNDSTPAGTVQDGYRKTLHPTPFGTSCTWDPVGGLPGK